MKKHIRSVTLAVFLTMIPQLAAPSRTARSVAIKARRLVIGGDTATGFGGYAGWGGANGGGSSIHDPSGSVESSARN